MNFTCPRLVDAPATNPAAIYETLGYLEAHDEVLDLDYAFVAYKEISRATGEWRVRIKSSQTEGAVFEPAMIWGHARATETLGHPWFQWGYSLAPRAGDPRQIQFRVHVKNGQPAEIEMFVQLRRFDHSADNVHSLRFAWPAA